jgi:hypothetical protein
MISKEEKDEIIAVIGKQYSIPIIDHLEAVGIKPKKATAFTPGLIRQIVNSEYENEDVEFEILKFVKITKRLKEKQAKKRKSLIKK